VGSGKLVARNGNDIGTLQVNRTRQQVRGGDYLLPFSKADLAADFHPKAPKGEIHGTIIDALDRVNEIGRFDVVVIDRGAKDGLEPGSVLQVNNRGEVVVDPVLEKQGIEKEDSLLGMPIRHFPAEVTLPEEEAGLLMVFRTFERVSFGIVMYTRKAIHLHDRVVNP
jgi:hypothetical protein